MDKFHLELSSFAVDERLADSVREKFGDYKG